MAESAGAPAPGGPPPTGARRVLEAGAAALLGYLVLWVTLVVLGHNLGSRPDVRFINGGKVFLASGAMWYHIPGLGEMDLAPQNFGGRANLRNNDFALLDLPLGRLDRMSLDLELDPGAYALVVVDLQDEGTFSALRLSALDDPDTPLDTAWVRYEGGVQVAHRPYPGGALLPPGPVSVEVDLAAGQISLDGDPWPLPAEATSLRPAPAVGCGELDVRLQRWAVTGAAPDGAAVDWEEDWSLLRWLPTKAAPLAVLAALGWLLLFGLPALKASLETRPAFDRVLVGGLLRPTPRLVYGLLCLCPWAPLLLQLVLFFNYLLLAWWGLLAPIGRPGRRWWLRPRVDHPAKGRAAALGLALALLGAALVAAGGARREAALGQPVPPSSQPRTLGGDRTAGPLELGAVRTVRLPGEDPSWPVTVSVDVELEPGEIARLDLLSQAPDDRDLFQVDRASQAADAPVDDGPSGHDFHGVSLVLSADPGLPSELLRARGFEVDRSPRPWTLAPGQHTVAVTVSLPLVQVAVDGVVVEVREDLAGALSGRADGAAGWGRAAPPRPVSALALQAWSERVRSVGPVQVQAAARGDDPLRAARAHLRQGALLGVVGAALAALGLGLLVLAATLGPGTLGRAVARLGRAHVALVVVLALVLVEHLGAGPGTTGLPLPQLALLAAALATLNLLLFQRAQGRAAAAALGLALLHGALVVEAAAPLWPGWQHRATRWWSDGVHPDHWWIYDPMVRRLNPWFVDARFKRREVSLRPAEGRTRVVVFGGSQTYGWGIPSKDRMAFSDQLQRRLTERGYDAEVVNASFPGVKSTVGLRWYAGNLRRYDADLIVINYVVNEFLDVDPVGVWSGEVDPHGRIAPLTALALLRRLAPDVRSSHLVQVVLAHRYQVRELEESLRTWLDLAADDGTPVVLSVEPTNLSVETAGRQVMRNDAETGAAVGVYRRLGAELGVPVYEPVERFLEQPTDLLFYDTMHLSRRGHAVFADGLADAVAAALGPPPAPPPPPEPPPPAAP